MKDLLEIFVLVLFVISLVLLVVVVLLSNIQPFFVKVMISLLIILGGLFIVQIESERKNKKEGNNSSSIKLITPVTEEEYDQIFKNENLIMYYCVNNNIFSLTKNIKKDDSGSICSINSDLYIKYPTMIVKVPITYGSFYEILKEIEKIFKELSSKNGFEKPMSASDKNFYVTGISVFRISQEQLAVRLVTC